jgi:hypothetical protein
MVKSAGQSTVRSNKVTKRQRKMAERRMNKLNAVTGIGHYQYHAVAHSAVAKAALPAPKKVVKKTVAAAVKQQNKKEKTGFLTFSPFDSRFPVFFESYSPWDARFPFGHVPREFPSFSPFDARFPVNGHGLFRNIYLAKQADKAAAKRKAGLQGYVAMFGKASPAAKPVAAPRPATQLPAAAFTAQQSVAIAPAFPRFSPMARTGAATNYSSIPSASPTAQSPLTAMRMRANGGAAASPAVRRPHEMR